jgi:hypothetical protein
MAALLYFGSLPVGSMGEPHGFTDGLADLEPIAVVLIASDLHVRLLRQRIKRVLHLRHHVLQDRIRHVPHEQIPLRMLLSRQWGRLILRILQDMADEKIAHSGRLDKAFRRFVEQPLVRGDALMHSAKCDSRV